MKAFSLAVLLLGALTFAQADGPRAQIEASTKRIGAAMKARNYAALTKELRAATTSDFKYVEGGQTQTIDQMIQNMKAGLGMMKKLNTCYAKVLSFNQKGNKATGTVEHTMSGTMIGQDKKTHTMTFTGVSDDIYVNQGGKWKLSTMTWKSQKQTMDGKPVNNTGH